MKSLFWREEQEMVLNGKNIWGSFVEVFVKFKPLKHVFFFIYYISLKI